MWHLPADGQKVYVWPTPGERPVAQPPAPGLVSAPSLMLPEGQLIKWDGFRYKQYLAGEFQFHDPRDEKERMAKPIADHLKEHIHAPKPPKYLQERLDEIAAAEEKAEEEATEGDAAPATPAPDDAPTAPPPPPAPRATPAPDAQPATAKKE